MRLQHWPSARFVMLAGLVLFVVIYLVWYAQKRPRRFPDHFKALFISVHVVAQHFRLSHYIGAEWLQLVSFVLLWIAFLTYYVQRQRISKSFDTPQYNLDSLRGQ